MPFARTAAGGSDMADLGRLHIPCDALHSRVLPGRAHKRIVNVSPWRVKLDAVPSLAHADYLSVSDVYAQADCATFCAFAS
jgi:hypothetical protein